MSCSIRFVCSLIVVSDMEVSCHFYEKILGQKVKYNFGENITFEGDFAIHQKAHYQMLIDQKEIRNGGNNLELYFEYDDVDEIALKLQEHQVAFVHPVRYQPWRQKVVRFYDPDMHIIEIGETMEHLAYRLFNENLTVEDISGITMLPLEFIHAAIENYSNKK